MPAGAVLAGGVDALHDDEQRMLLLGIEEVLEMGELGDIVGEFLGCFRLGVVLAAPGGVDVLETDLRAGPDDQFLAVVHAGLLA